MELIKTYKRPYTKEQVKRVEMFCKIKNLIYTDLVIGDKFTTFTAYDNSSYDDLVVKLIRERYTLNQELAILRQRDEKPSEFETYNLYAENCKEQAKQFIKERELILNGN